MYYYLSAQPEPPAGGAGGEGRQGHGAREVQCYNLIYFIILSNLS